jgi:hypothetical protein
MERVLFAKRLFMHGCDHCDSTDPFSLSLAIHHFHAAIDTVLKAIVLELAVRTSTELNISFEVLFNEADKGLNALDPPKRLPLKAEIITLNTIRNLVQHHAYEGAAKAHSTLALSERFLRAVCRDGFGIDFDNLSMADMVACEAARQQLREAETHRANGDHRMAAAACRMAFDAALREAADSYRADRERRHRTSVSGVGSDLIAMVRDELDETVAPLEEMVLFGMLGLDYSGYRNLIARVPYCRYKRDPNDNAVYCRTDPPDGWSEDDLAPIYRFVAHSAILLGEARPFPPKPRTVKNMVSWYSPADFVYEAPVVNQATPSQAQLDLSNQTTGPVADG